MTEQIIIDGVDVSGCEHLYTDSRYNDKCCSASIGGNCLCKPSEMLCVKYVECLKVQLKRKEQSEEKLVKQIQTICDFINNRPETFKGVNGSVDKIITDYAKAKEQECERLGKHSVGFARKCQNLELDVCHLKDKNYNLQRQLDQLKAENEELKKRVKGEIHLGNRYKEDFVEQFNEAEKYKQTLQEIKEIAEEYRISNSYYTPLARKILGKISEVEDV